MAVVQDAPGWRLRAERARLWYVQPVSVGMEGPERVEVAWAALGLIGIKGRKENCSASSFFFF